MFFLLIQSHSCNSQIYLLPVLESFFFQAPDYLAKCINQQIIVGLAISQSKVNKREYNVKFCLRDFPSTVSHRGCSSLAIHFRWCLQSSGPCVNLYSFRYFFLPGPRTGSHMVSSCYFSYSYYFYFLP